MELISNAALDLIIPRGGEGLKKLVTENAVAPVLGAGGGICHGYIAESADLQMASEIIFNAKTQRPGVCNSLETVLLHKNHLQDAAFGQVFDKLLGCGVELRADDELFKFYPDKLKKANQKDWETEYLDLILSVKTVSHIDEAIEHINNYGTGHSEVIITNDEKEAELFAKKVDSAAVYVNASTRFTDGEVFGFGAEIGISTQKIHARGPIGPAQLTTYKYIIKGNGQVR